MKSFCAFWFTDNFHSLQNSVIVPEQSWNSIENVPISWLSSSISCDCLAFVCDSCCTSNNPAEVSWSPPQSGGNLHRILPLLFQWVQSLPHWCHHSIASATSWEPLTGLFPFWFQERRNKATEPSRHRVHLQYRRRSERLPPSTFVSIGLLNFVYSLVNLSKWGIAAVTKLLIATVTIRINHRFAGFVRGFDLRCPAKLAVPSWTSSLFESALNALCKHRKQVFVL